MPTAYLLFFQVMLFGFAVWKERFLSSRRLVNQRNTIVFTHNLSKCQPPNGLRYPRWGGDGEAVQPEK